MAPAGGDARPIQAARESVGRLCGGVSTSTISASGL